VRNEILKYFVLQHQIFGVCPCCGELFRLSDCRISMKTRPMKDWMDRLNQETKRLDQVEERLEEKREDIKEKARESGRREAARQVRKVDWLFAPRRLDPDDAKVLFHPVDYIVFNGMKKQEIIRGLILLDRKTRVPEHRKIQKSIEKVIEKGRYEWLTLRVLENGSIKEE
jgi:predicted Holliday junction resolvase-like endonuclease